MLEELRAPSSDSLCLSEALFGLDGQWKAHSINKIFRRRYYSILQRRVLLAVIPAFYKTSRLLSKSLQWILRIRWRQIWWRRSSKIKSIRTPWQASYKRVFTFSELYIIICLCLCVFLVVVVVSFLLITVFADLLQSPGVAFALAFLLSTSFSILEYEETVQPR